MITQKLLSVATKYNCEMCDYKCCNKTNFSKHILTRRHLNRYTELHKNCEKLPSKYACSCGRQYTYRQGLYAHKKTCIPNIVIIDNVNEMKRPIDEIQILTNLVTELVRSNSELVKQNQDVQQKMLELCKNGTHVTNSNNKSFNINLFLNEQCKDAINFHEFVENIKVSREDLMSTGQLGFVGGISKILLDQLKQLGVHERPIHCTDLKRDTVYIKENNEWNKEEDDVKIRSAIQEVTRKSMGTLIDWKKNNPDYEDMDSKFSQDCLLMQRNSIAGYERDTLLPKVIRELNKALIIDKVN
jgi:hypothetical protein